MGLMETKFVCREYDMLVKKLLPPWKNNQCMFCPKKKKQCIIFTSNILKLYVILVSLNSISSRVVHCSSLLLGFCYTKYQPNTKYLSFSSPKLSRSSKQFWTVLRRASWTPEAFLHYSLIFYLLVLSSHFIESSCCRIWVEVSYVRLLALLAKGWVLVVALLSLVSKHSWGVVSWRFIQRSS